MLFDLPTHPSQRHPLTGAPIRALGFRRDGRAIWPILGGDDTVQPNGDAGGAAGDGGRTTAGDPPFPANTPVDNMTAEQRAAYWEHHAKKHEGRNKGLLALTGGKYGDALKAELDDLARLRDASRTDAERDVEAAKQATRAEVRQEYGTRLAAAEFRAALAHVEDDRRTQIIEGLSLEKYLTEDGDVDTDKVKSYAATIAPPDKDQGSQRHDFGAGRRGGGTKTGVGAGAELFAASRKKTTTGS